MDELFAVFGPEAVVVALVYAGAIQALTGLLKRAAGSHELTARVKPSTWVLVVGVVTGPAVWPWLWRVAGLDAELTPGALQAAILGIGTAAVAHLLYPIVTRRIMDRVAPP